MTKDGCMVLVFATISYTFIIILRGKLQRPIAGHVMMQSLVYSRLCNVCRSLSYRGIILVCMTAIFTFLLVEYVHFDVWNSHKYITVSDCQEDVYVFEPDEYHTSPLQDASLAQKCHQYSDLYHRVSQTENKEQQEPVIFTKCRLKMAHPISRIMSPNTTRTSTGLNYQVPNTVHYVSLGRWEFTFLNYLSVRSVHLHIKPDRIIFHGDRWVRAIIVAACVRTITLALCLCYISA